VRLTQPQLTGALLLALAAAGGVVDGLSFLGLGQVFTANMTGNTVLLGVAVARHSGTDAARAAVALGGFAVGAALGTLLMPRRGTQPWPRIAERPFAFESVALLVLLILWVAIGVDQIRLLLIAVSAVAMGAQSAAVRASHVSGVNTTFVTGTLLNAIARSVERLRGDERGPAGPTLPGVTWLIYGIGALVGAVGVNAWHAGIVALPVAIVAAVTVVTFLSKTQNDHLRVKHSPMGKNH
jgi:uncharacterized membrane protein YoaK (UPF0700 family)